MNERLKELRVLLDLTQNEFGEKIGLTAETINAVEKGECSLTDHSISLICMCFGVNEIWLLAGIGGPFDEMTEDEKLARFFGGVCSIEGDNVVKKIMIGLSKLNESQWNALDDIIRTISGK